LGKAVDHGVHNEHSEKTRTCDALAIHPVGEMAIPTAPRFLAVPAVPPWFELRFVGLRKRRNGETLRR
jgi:hypothetical protein